MKLPLSRLPLVLVGVALTASTLLGSDSKSAKATSTISVLLSDDQGGENVVRLINEDRRARTSRTMLLRGAHLLDIDFSNRTQLEKFLPNRPRLSLDVGDGARLVLPLGAGSLYRYQRQPLETVRFGLMYVGSDGRARSVLELDGIGNNQDECPFLKKVAVASDGRNLLVATKLEAGGDLLQVRLESGVTLNRTANHSPQEFAGEGLALASEWGFGISTDGLLRFETTNNSQAAFVAFPAPQPTYFGCEAVLSANGLFAVTIAGTSETATHPFTFSKNGAAICANPDPMHLRGSGALPDALDGPFLAVSNDGEDCAFVAFEGTSRELYFSKSCPTADQAPFHLTQDSLFHPYLDEIGLLSFKFGRLLFSAGDRKDPVLGGLTLSSYYRASWGAPGVQPPILDLAHSYANAQPPFLDYTSLDPVSVHMTPDRDSYVVHSRSGELGEVSGVRLTGHSGQLFTLLSDVKSIDMIEVADDQIFISAAIDEAEEESQIFKLPTTLSGVASPVITLPDEDVNARTVQPSGAVAFVAPSDSSADTLWSLHSQGSTPISLTLRRGEFGKTLALTQDGSLVFTVVTEGTSESLFIWGKEQRPRLLLRHSGSIQILPAN